MKVASLMLVLARVAVLVLLGTSVGHAQTEIDPDHFDFSNAEPFPQPTPADTRQLALTDYEGTFNLPFAVWSGGRNLSPGKYSISLRFNDKVAEATLKSNGRVVGLSGMVRSRSRKQRSPALVVEDRGKNRTLAAILVAGLNFAFDAGFQPETAIKRMLIHIESSP